MGEVWRAHDEGLGRDVAIKVLPAGFAGDTERALDWLEKAYRARDPNMPYLVCMPLFDPLRSEPRCQDLVRRLNLPVQ